MADNNAPPSPNLAPAEGPFTEMLTQGMHPAVQQQPQQQLTGWEGKGGIFAMLGDRALQGIQRGRLMRYMAQETQKSQRFNDSINDVYQRIQVVQNDPNLSPEIKQNYVSDLMDTAAKYRAAYWNHTMGELDPEGKGGMTGQKQKKQKQGKSGAPNTDGPGAPGGGGAGKPGMLSQAGGFGHQVAGVIGGILNRMAGPNLPESDIANTNWVSGQIHDIGKKYTAAQTFQDRTAEINKIKEEMKDAKDQSDVQAVLSAHLPKMQTLWSPQELTQVANTLTGARLDWKEAQEKQIMEEANKVRYGDQTGQTPQDPQGPPQGSPSAPNYTPARPASPAGPKGSQQTSTQDPRQGLQLSPTAAKSPLSPYFRPAPKSLAYPGVITQLQKEDHITDPVWFMRNEKTGKIVELQQYMAVSPTGGARFYDPATGYDVDAETAEANGWELSATRPYKDSDLRYEFRDMELNGNSYIVALDPRNPKLEPIIMGRAPTKDSNPSNIKIFDEYKQNRKELRDRQSKLNKDLRDFQDKIRLSISPYATKEDRDAARKFLLENGVSAEDLDNIEKGKKKPQDIMQARAAALDIEKKDIQAELDGNLKKIRNLARDKESQSFVDELLQGTDAEKKDDTRGGLIKRR